MHEQGGENNDELPNILIKNQDMLMKPTVFPSYA